MTPSIDALRVKYPLLGFAIYAYQPGGLVTLECLNPAGQTFTFTGATEAEAILKGFADDFAEPMPTPAPPTTNVFE